MAKVRTVYAAIVMLLVGINIQCAHSNVTIFVPVMNNLSSAAIATKPNYDEPGEIIPDTSPTDKNDIQDMLIPPADVNANIAQIHNVVQKKGQIIISSEGDCPSLKDADNLSQTQLLKRLTHGCRYDRLERPITYGVNGTRLPVQVWTRVYLYFMQNLEAHDLEYKIQCLLQLRYVDPRLVFKEVSPNRKEPILGEQSLRDALWIPHIFLANERSSSILGTSEKDILTSISPDGTVIISKRMEATLYCWMNLQKFPFDEQTCSTVFESWMYNTTELMLHWELKSPVTFAREVHLTEYVLLNFWSNETIVNADLSDLRHGAFAGNYSSLSFSVHLAREMGFYLMDYFIPSIMIVAISWVSFWLQADQGPPRIMLGTSTMLTFITLASAQGKTLPKVSYIKVSEVWFLGCTAFIFGSLVEFAFVNTIWRWKNNVELKKVTSKYILRTTLTPQPIRKDLGHPPAPAPSASVLQKSRSCTSLYGSLNNSQCSVPTYNNYLTVHGSIPTITTQSMDDLCTPNGGNNSGGGGNNNVNMEPTLTRIQIQDNENEDQNEKSGWTTMTPQEIAYWIDERSRICFPVTFIIFNVLYWTFVYCLSEGDCPSLHDADSLSQTQLVKRLTHGCRYDRLERPITYGANGTRQPVMVWTRVYLYFMQNLEAHDLEYKIQCLLQLRYVDPRLVFKEVSPKRKEPILGEASLRDALWIPHIFLANERSSSILGTSEKDILTSISPDGTVIISKRMEATLYCWMNLQKFPFDEQTCSTVFESWMYNTTELILHWELKSPVTFAREVHLTEYVLLDFWANESIVNADLSDLRHGAFAGNYSSLSFSVHLAREMGFYLMDYFIPSIMIVAISWVSFWLQADQAPPRIMLGTSTMLTFITLASAQGKTLPKVSYIKVSEVWFLGCTGFIFGSLVEFAFVNTIWRWKNNVELKKVNSKYILKSTLTPRPVRKDLGGGSLPGLQKSRSCSSLDGSTNNSQTSVATYNNYLTVHGSIPTITTQSMDDLCTSNGGNNNVAVNMEPATITRIQMQDNAETNEKSGWTTMTPQEIAYWIDERSRIVFPVTFMIFNAFYWTFVYCL